MSVLFGGRDDKAVLGGLFGSCDSDEDDEPSGGEIGVEGVNPDLGVTELLYHSESSRGSFEVKLFQQKIKGIAHQLWPAATHMCRYIDANLDSVFSAHGGVERTRVIELGAGIGLVGLYLSVLGCSKVLLTDLPKAMDILQKNIDANERASTAVCLPLSWGNVQETEVALAALLGEGLDDDEFPPLIVAADCVYWESLFELLVITLCKLCQHREGTRVLMSHVRRWKKDAKFFKMCQKKGLLVEVISETIEQVPAEHTGINERTITRIYRITNKK